MAYLERKFYTKPVSAYRENVVMDYVKYFAITLGECLNFNAHFGRLSRRKEGVATILGCLLLNVGGPNEGVRLYICVIICMTMYVAPVWFHHISNPGTQGLRRV